MGTDIHMAAEVAIYNEDGERIGWQAVPGPIIDCWNCEGSGLKTVWENRAKVAVVPHAPCPSCCPTPEEEIAHYDYGEDTAEMLAYYQSSYVGPGKQRDEWFSDRNYRVFAALTILSNEHSQTWLTLAEVMAYDWKQPMRQSGVVDMEQYRVFVQRGRPESWTGDVWGGAVKFVTLDEANALLAAGQCPESTYVRIEWNDSMEDYASSFVERMQMLMLETGGSECRLVFDFDS